LKYERGEKTTPAHQNLLDMQKTFLLEKKVGKNMGSGEVLQ
jgi:hypothetical protein